MEIITERLRLIPCTPENCQAHVPAEYKLGAHIHHYHQALALDPELLGWGVWLVIRQDDGTVIGDMGFKGKPDDAHMVEVGYGIAPEAQQQGYATEAVRGLINWAHATGRVRLVTAECLADNVASVRVLQKLGMLLVGQAGDMLKWELQLRALQ